MPTWERQDLRCPIIIHIALPFQRIPRKSCVRVIAASKVKLRVLWVLGCSVEAPAHLFWRGNSIGLIGLRHSCR